MCFKKTISFLVVIFFSFQIIAQQSATYTSQLADYQKALSVFKHKQYPAAQALFKSLETTIEDPTLLSDCTYYIAHCAVRLNQKKADQLIRNFVKNHPISLHLNAAFSDAGDYYYNNKNYESALKWYDKVDEQALSKNQRATYYFNKGYAAFSSKQYQRAKTYFSKVSNVQKYTSQVKYYLGFIAYYSDDYAQAAIYFEQVSNQARYKEKLAYYQANLNFKCRNFKKAIELAKARLNTSDNQERSELSKIIGESYFHLKEYDVAIPFLKAYQGQKTKTKASPKWNHTDYYQLGYAYYKQKDFQKAISEFNKIVGGTNSIAQNAYYHLGESYINLNKKQEALTAFRNASQMDANLKIQEDAWLNYAKISYDIGNPFESVTHVLTTYLKAYPKSNDKEDIETLLVDSYISSRNYEEALDLLKNTERFENKVAYQKVAFYRGLELFNDSQYVRAKTLFEASLKQPRDSNFTARATFWKAECDYNLENFEEALKSFKLFKQSQEAPFTPEIKNIDYNLGYTYFKLKDYPKAITHFHGFTSKKQVDKLRLNDAFLRLGDTHFVSRDYQSAITAYDKAIKIDIIEPDYPTFQQAMSLGYLGQASKKIPALEQFIVQYSTSKLRDDALYELGNTYVKENNTNQALATYDKLCLEYKKSSFVPKALLRQGLIYFNASNNKKALKKFKTVASYYGATTEAIQAVATARLIYIDLGRVDDYAQWVKTLEYIEVTDVDLDHATYEAVEKQYLNSKTDLAIKQFNHYLMQFPKGLHALQAHFYLAQLYHKKELFENAAPHYQYVIEAPQNEYTEEALVQLAQYQLLHKSWNQAITLLKSIEESANFPQNTIFAQSNLMTAYYQLQNYEDAFIYAEKVLGSSKIDNKIKSDAYLIIARSAVKINNETKAELAYEELAKIATGETAAEALYHTAYFKNKKGHYKASNQTIQKLAKGYSGFKYFSAKGLVIMAKNYDALNDAFQATYILESVIQNFPEYKDVVSEANKTLQTIKTKQAKTNASIQLDAQ